MKRLGVTIAVLALIAMAWHGVSVVLRSPKEREFRAALGGIDLINDPLQEKLYRRVCDVAKSVSDGPVSATQQNMWCELFPPFPAARLTAPYAVWSLPRARAECCLGI